MEQSTLDGVLNKNKLETVKANKMKLKKVKSKKENSNTMTNTDTLKRRNQKIGSIA